MWVLRGVVAALLSPLGTALALGLVSGVVLALASARRKRLRRVAGLIGAFALAWLWLWSTPVASHGLRSWMEAQAGPESVRDVAPASIAVVLGGGMRGQRSASSAYPDLALAADRVWHAARLYHAGKAPLLLLSGGVVRPDEGAEALAMQIFLRDLGVPDAAMLLEPRSTTTAENAAFSADMLRERGVQRVILVTSALHMRRARAVFEHAGLAVTPAPTDFESLGRKTVARDWIPSAEALGGSARAFKELLGSWLGPD